MVCAVKGCHRCYVSVGINLCIFIGVDLLLDNLIADLHHNLI